MEQSILLSTKKILGLDEAYEAFDLDVITHINSAFFVIHQLGIGPVDGFEIEDSSAEWGDFVYDGDLTMLNMIKTYVFLKVSILFDPPQMGYLIDLKTKQLQEAEWRLTVAREEEVDLNVE